MSTRELKFLMVAVIYGFVMATIAGDTILVFDDKQSKGGGLQKSAYALAAEKFHDSMPSMLYHQCEEGETDPQLIRSLVADGLLNVTDCTSDSDRVVVVGSCSTEYPQSLFSQVLCNSQVLSTTYNVVNLQATITSIYPALRDLLSSMNTSSVSMGYSRREEVNHISGMLLSDGFSVRLGNYSHKADVASPQVAIVLDKEEACRAPVSLVTILLSVGDNFTFPLCEGDNSNIYIISWKESPTSFEMLQELDASQLLHLLQNFPDMGTLDDRSCRYTSLVLTISTLANTSTDGQLLDKMKSLQERTLLGANSEEETERIVVIRRNNELTSIIGEWSHKMGLNLTGEIEPPNGSETTIDVYNTQLTALGVISAFALIGVVYSAALIGFNCSKSKDRTIKLTSPNMNIIICFGGILALLSVPLLGVERPILVDLRMLGTIQQAGMFSMSVGLTIIYSSVLVKTWRVHRIFKKMHLSSKGTKDEHLMLMVLAFTIVDIAINATWAKVDQINCVDYLSLTYTQGSNVICSSKYQEVWICLLSFYKLLITIITLFYAWHVRHVKLPSLQDSQFILSNSLITIVVLLTNLPAVASSETINTTRYSTVGVSTLALVYSALSLLLAPKVFLVRNKDGSKTNSAVKFLFGESLKKQKERDEPPKGCWAGLTSCNSQSGSSMGDSILSQEIETLKQLVKEKDETIRELTDRLFFGADKFKAYVNDKTASYRRSCSSPAVSTITDLDHHHHHKTRSRQSRLHQKSQCSPVSSVDSGNVEDVYHNHSQSKTQPNYYTMENPASSKYSAQSQLSHTLPPIKELSVNDLANHLQPMDEPRDQIYSAKERSVTPTTDSAINMSHSASSSDDESYHDRSNVTLPKGFNSLNHAHLAAYQHQNFQANSLKSKHKTGKNAIAAAAIPEHLTDLKEKRSQYIGERLAAVTDRRQSTNQHRASNKQTNHYALYSKDRQQPKEDTNLNRDEVEMEVMFPVSECL